MTTYVLTVPADLIVERAFEKREDGSEEEVSLKLRGHAAVFEEETLIGSRRFGFVEEIARGAFDGVLDDDVRFLRDHRGMTLARTKSGTLRISVDKDGLLSEPDLSPTTEGRDLAIAVERGDIDQMSFAFTILEDDVEMLSDDHAEFPGMPKRTITKIGRLFDVSAVSFPAYEGTDLAARSGLSEVEIRGIMERGSVDDDETTSEPMPQEDFDALERVASRHTASADRPAPGHQVKESSNG